MPPTAERLRAAWETRDPSAIAAVLVDLSETERAELQPVARVIVDGVVRGGTDEVRNLPPMLLIAFGVLPATEIRELGWRSGHLRMAGADVLRNRDPARLGPIVELLLDGVGGGSAWAVVRRLVRDGAVPRPDRPAYTIGMLAATRHRPAADLVAADPGLMDVEAWRLFEVEGGGEDSLANHEKFFGDSWGKLFRGLAARDPVARSRLLDASLAALGRDFATYRAGWFSRFHDSLAPADDELAARADVYLGLLRSRVGPTVSMAVAALTRIDKAGRLDPSALLERIGPALSEGSGGAAKAALRLVTRAAQSSPGLATRAALVAVEALGHPAADVQAAALATIVRMVTGPDPDVGEAVMRHLPEVVASQRAAATALAARLVPSGANSVADGTSDAAATTSSPAARDSVPVGVGRRAIEPIRSVDALVDAAVSVIESGEPADDVERVLEAVGRLGKQRPAGFTRLVSPLARRARTILARADRFPFSGIDVRADVAAVLLAWSTETVVETAFRRRMEPGAGAFLSARAREVAQAVAAGQSFMSVALPTHARGWIEPLELVRRVAAGPPASRLDLVAAMLRLSQDNRDAALDEARALGGEVGGVVRYALGGDERIGPTAAWWVAAARVRRPGEDDDAVEKRHPRLGPDAGQAAKVRLRPVTPGEHAYGLAMDTDPPMPETVDVGLPTVLMLRPPVSLSWAGRSDVAMLRWMATIQPGDREGWAAVGTVVLGRNVDWWSAEWANRGFLEPFVDPATPIGPNARLLLGVALGARETGERGLASDVVRQALSDGRLTAGRIAEGLAGATSLGVDRPNRWAGSLMEAAGSRGHAAALAEAIGLVLPAVADRPIAKLVPLLRALDELLAETGGAVAPEAADVLGRLSTGSGQAARVARSILERGAAG